MKYQEIEVKYYLEHPARLHALLEELGAELVQPRTHEINLRFDTPAGELSRSYRVLRLRQDTDARMTYKGPGELIEGARSRQEIEFVVSDFQAAQAFLEALGFQVSMMYEKYRSIYDLDKVHVTLDEMPYGDFCELEGETPEAILNLSQRLGLNWERRVLDSYTMIFDRVKQDQGLTIRDLSFENFRDLKITPQMLSVQAGDVPSDQ
jgi:adenylate cyclase, class 2